MTTNTNGHEPEEDLFAAFHDALDEEPEENLTSEQIMERAFWVFHNANPEVYQMLRGFAFQERAENPGYLSMKLLYERVRKAPVQTGESPKLNNNHHAFYARLLMDREEGLQRAFKLRRQRVQSNIGPPNSTLEPNVRIGPEA